MQFLADENFPHPSIILLRHAGYIVSSVSELYPGISDAEVILKSKQDNLIILTFDKDYGEIIFKHGQDTDESIARRITKHWRKYDLVYGMIQLSTGGNTTSCME